MGCMGARDSNRSARMAKSEVEKKRRGRGLAGRLWARGDVDDREAVQTAMRKEGQ